MPSDPRVEDLHSARASVQIHVFIPATVRTWLLVEAGRNGLTLSAFVRQKLTREYTLAHALEDAGRE